MSVNVPLRNWVTLDALCSHAIVLSKNFLVNFNLYMSQVISYAHLLEIILIIIFSINAFPLNLSKVYKFDLLFF